MCDPVRSDETDLEGLRHLIEHIQDAVVAFELVDGEPIVRGVNESFVECFGYDRGEIVGARLNEYIVPAWLQREATELDRRTDAGEINYSRVQRQTDEGLREFLYRGVPYDGEDVDGYAVYTDLTDVSRTERQLQVLTRVLRHNLRNETTVIRGNVERLAEQLDESEHDGIVTATREAADRLRKLSEEAGQIQRVLDGSGGDDIDVVPIIEETLAKFCRRHPDAVIEADLPSSSTVVASFELRAAIEALVENAIEHNPADRPRVRVGAESVLEGEWVDLTVDDDGPEIPEMERAVVAGDAEITPRQHGSGLGLWLVKWTAERFGGELAFEESLMDGNRVRLRLRRGQRQTDLDDDSADTGSPDAREDGTGRDP